VKHTLLIALSLLLTYLPAEARIARKHSAKLEFQREIPCPSTSARTGKCNGYVIDHIKALACGGADDPINMQWQTIADGKAKDNWERKECGK
jgi:hypothetical protein